MADVSISYKGNEIASMNATGVKTLLTSSAFCEDDITVTYTKPAAPVPSLQTKSATYTPSTSQQTASITADAGYDGLDEVNVTVNAMPSGSATTPATTITANPTISVSSGGLITATVSASQSVTPTVSAGYVSSGTAGTVSVSGSNTSQLTTQAAQTITPTTTNQTIASGKYLTGTQTILGSENLLPENIKKDVVIFGITGTYEGDVPSGYTVTVSLTNPVNASEFSGCDIVEQITSANMDTGSLLGSVSSASGNETVTVSASIYGINVTPSGTSISVPTSGISCTGGVTYAGSDYMGGYKFEVTGNGAITFDGIDYDD